MRKIGVLREAPPPAKHTPRNKRPATGVPHTPNLPEAMIHIPRMIPLTCFIAMFFAAGVLPIATAGDDQPRGTLSTASSLVRAGTPTMLSWRIELPSDNVHNVIDIDDDGTITPKKNLTMRIRMLGASFQRSATEYLPVEVKWRRGTRSWRRVFYGYQTEVDPTEVLVKTKVRKNVRLEFGGRGYRYGWLPFYSTLNSTPNLVALTNGDRPPETTPAFQQGRIESFLQPYLSSDGSLQLGPRDVIFLIETGQTNPRNSGFDLQDIVFLVTFE